MRRHGRLWRWAFSLIPPLTGACMADDFLYVLAISPGQRSEIHRIPTKAPLTARVLLDNQDRLFPFLGLTVSLSASRISNVSNAPFGNLATSKGKIFHATRREWIDNEGIMQWQWFLVLEPLRE